MVYNLRDQAARRLAARQGISDAEPSSSSDAESSSATSSEPTSSPSSSSSPTSTSTSISTDDTPTSTSARPRTTPTPTPSRTLAPSSISMVTQVTVITSNGQVITTVTAVPTALPGTAAGKSNTGAIAGGVVGGILALTVLIFVLWFIRRKGKKDKLEAEIFDPNSAHVQRPGKLKGEVDLANDPQLQPSPYNYRHSTGSGTVVTTAGSAAGAAAAARMSQADPRMSAHSPAPSDARMSMVGPGGRPMSGNYSNYPPSLQAHGQPGEIFHNNPAATQNYLYGGSPYPQMGGGPPSSYGAPTVIGAAGLGRGPSDASSYPPSSQYGSTTPGGMGQFSPQSGRPMSDGGFSNSSGGGGPYAAMLAPGGFPATSDRSSSHAGPKGQEAQAGRLHLANEDRVGSPVVQHSDGGRVPEPEPASPPQEIPPSYDSIPRDAAGGSSSQGPATAAQVPVNEKVGRPSS